MALHFEEPLTKAQKKLVQIVSYYHLSSLRRLYEDNSKSENDLVMMLIEHDVSEDEYKCQILANIDRFKKINKNPEEFTSMSPHDLVIFKTILNALEDRYNKIYPKAISNLWQRLFFITDFKTSFNSN